MTLWQRMSHFFEYGSNIRLEVESNDFMKSFESSITFNENCYTVKLLWKECHHNVADNFTLSNKSWDFTATRVGRSYLQMFVIFPIATLWKKTGTGTLLSHGYKNGSSINDCLLTGSSLLPRILLYFNELQVVQIYVCGRY